MSLKEYRRKRRFGETPEPMGPEEDASETSSQGGDRPLRFVVQKHAATRLHFDLRLEIGGVFKSWAVPKGPTLNPNEQRLAVAVEDHPLDYGSFEGVIPKGNYGAGTVMIWDAGTYVERPARGRERTGLAEGNLKFVLQGHKLAGEFALVRVAKDPTGKTWLLIKKRDRYAHYGEMPDQDVSVATGRTMAEIAAEAPAKGEVWLPGKGPENPDSLQDKVHVTAHAERNQDIMAMMADLRSASARLPRVPPTETVGSPTPESLPRKPQAMLPEVRLEPVLALTEDWELVPYHGGLRSLAVIADGKATLLSRQHLSFDRRFPALRRDLARLSGALVLDGEIVVLDEAGRISDAQAKARDGEGRALYLVWDLLHQDGMNLRNLPLRERRLLLDRIEAQGGVPSCLRVSPLFQDLTEATHAAAEIGFKDVLARHRSSPYVAGASALWLRMPLPGSGATASTMVAPLSHADRVYWPKEGYTKGDLYAYYRDVASLMFPYLEDRPHSLHRHPHGIEAESFYQKDLSGYRPPWIKTVRIVSGHGGRTIEYLVCANSETIAYMANLGCIEINPWLSRVNNLDQPDFAVLDIDPDRHEYGDVVRVALAAKSIMDEHGVTAYVKTSGATGMHLYIPLSGARSYSDARHLTEGIARRVEQMLPDLTTMERNPDRRRGRIYLDCGQNRRGQTLAAPYSVRPRPGATVSTPLHWDEVDGSLDPRQFTLRSVPERLAKIGDIWAQILREKQDVGPLLAALGEGG